jgi:hypothetical protein
MSSSLNIVASVTPDTVTNSISQSGHGLIVGDIIRRDSGGSYVKAQGDSLANSLALGVVSQVVSSDGFKFVQVGLVNGLSGLVDGTQYYLDTAVSGGTRTTETSTEGEVIKPIYTAVSTTAAYVDIKKSEVVAAAPAGGGGALEFVAQRNITVGQATIEFDNTEVTTTYATYELHFREIKEPSGNADSLILSLSANGSFDDNANYPGYMKTINSAGTEANVNMNASSGCLICPNIRTNNAVGAHGFGVVRFQNLTTSGSRPRLIDVSGTSNVLDGGFNIITQRYQGGAGRNAGLDPVDGIKLKMLNSATLTGVATLYGLKES